MRWTEIIAAHHGTSMMALFADEQLADPASSPIVFFVGNASYGVTQAMPWPQAERWNRERAEATERKMRENELRDQEWRERKQMEPSRPTIDPEQLVDEVERQLAARGAQLTDDYLRRIYQQGIVGAQQAQLLSQQVLGNALGMGALGSQVTANSQRETWEPYQRTLPALLLGAAGVPYQLLPGRVISVAESASAAPESPKPPLPSTDDIEKPRKRRIVI